MLRSIGEEARAAEVLAVATEELEAANRERGDASNRWRLLGSAYRFAGRDEDAEAAFARAIELDELQLQSIEPGRQGEVALVDGDDAGNGR